MMRLFVCIVAFLFTSPALADTLRMAVTTSFHNSGLADVLLPQIKADTDHDVQLLVVGTGQALQLGRAGDVDAVLVHAKAAELAFVAAGYAPYRREIMYNDFVILGPSLDPANIKNAVGAVDALERIAATGSVFASRGDDSGTHKAELALWGHTKSGPAKNYYRETGSGMGATLNYAVSQAVYVIADRASWLNFGNKGDLTILFEGDPKLFNQYAFLPVSQSRHAHINRAAAQDVEDWLTGPVGQGLIAAYALQEQQLFFPNAK